MWWFRTHTESPFRNFSACLLVNFMITVANHLSPTSATNPENTGISRDVMREKDFWRIIKFSVFKKLQFFNHEYFSNLYFLFLGNNLLKSIKYYVIHCSKRKIHCLKIDIGANSIILVLSCEDLFDSWLKIYKT